ncbi:MAG: hypothetical protein OXE50_11955 [Chloroflexi bacterium]|nr:hypothetical protein [Chloroflexota bacterium]
MIHKSSLLAASVIMLTLVACGDSEEAQTAAGETSAATSPTADVTGGTLLSLDDYITTVCGGQSEVGAWEEGESLRELSEGLGFISEQMSALEPPVEVAEWHDAQIAFAGAFKEEIDDFLDDPGDRTEDEFLLSMFFTLASLFEPVEQAVAGMNPDVRARMIEAGCIDEETAESIPMEMERDEITVGGSASGSLEGADDTGSFQFQAERGVEYLIQAAWADLPAIYLVLTEPSPVNTIRLLDSDSSPYLRRWTARASGLHFIDVASDAAGSYTISVSLDASPETPSNVQAAWDGPDVRVSWDPVEGADYYIVYHEDFVETGCSADIDGNNPRWCEQVATNVTGTSYAHTVRYPDRDDSFYFVAACNSEGCSPTDSNNPVTPTGVIPCSLHLDLEEGESCTVDIPGVNVGTNLFEVRNSQGCYGNICADGRLDLNGFIAAFKFELDSWSIYQFPRETSGGASTPVPTPGSGS